MTSQGPLQTPSAAAEEADRHSDIPEGARQLKGWQTVKDLRVTLRFSSDNACRAWLGRQGVARVRRGRVLLVDGVDVERVLRGR